MSLYLKYRSATFDDIVEQDYTKAILKQQVIKSFAGEQFSNYLFYGSRGIGKTSIARIMAKALNCLNNRDGNPCNICESCKLISENRSMDIIEIDAASHTGVDNIREEIIWKAIYPPVQLRKKVTIIDEVHMLSTGAFNALLKIMEEPPSYLVFILATTELHKVPETIASRCQVFNFKRITMDGIVGRLEYICKKEGFTYERAGLEIIARIADGGMRDAVKYLDQVSILGMIDEKTVGQCLGVTSESVIKAFVENYNQKNSVALVEIITNLQQDGVDVFIFLKEILNYVDRNLNADSLPLLLPIAWFIKTCYEKLKYFPHPYVLLKSEVVQLSVINLSVWGSASSTSPYQERQSIGWTTWSVPPDKEGGSWQSQETGGLLNTISVGNNEFDELKDRIVRNIASPSIKSIRESACHIEKLDERLLIVQVIEKWKMTLLTLGKNKQDVEKICSEVLGREIVLEYQFLDKEEFLRKGLDGMLA
jgi:DNA polymerase III subunit gamma/tau